MPWLAHTRHAYAQMLLDRHGPGDTDRAQALERSALAAARDLHMRALAAECDPAPRS
jgi:hypothetical protein